MTDRIEVHGRVGNYISDAGIISFQMGEGRELFDDTMFSMPWKSAPMLHEHHWLSVQGYNVCMRGRNNTLCDEITHEIKQNRLLPRLYSKEIKMLYGHGPTVYMQTISGGKPQREWTDLPDVSDWLHTWDERGLPTVEEFCKTEIKNYYYFGDFFAKWRFSRGKRIGVGMPVAGLEAMENKNCLLATTRRDVATALVDYSDFRFVAVGKWFFGTGSYKIYPKFAMNEASNYLYAAISHHREKSVDEFYGVNETHQGARPYIQGSNKTAIYINSFLKNSLAAKIHIIIPNAWVESKRNQIMKLCEENKKRLANKQPMIKYNGIEIGDELKESTVIEYIRQELGGSSAATSPGKQPRQGVQYVLLHGRQRPRTVVEDREHRHEVQGVYQAMIAYDKRTREALLSSVGLDASISAVSKDGVISKSGSDAYYNYLIYIMSL